MFASVCVRFDIYVHLSAFPLWRQEPQLCIATDMFLSYGSQTLSWPGAFLKSALF